MKIDSNYNYNLKQTGYKPNFQRNWSEHVSWGARYAKELGKADFKLFSFPDAKMVFVEVAKKAGDTFGKIKERIIQVLAAQGITLTINEIFAKDDNTSIHQMEHKGDGIFEAKGIEAEENAQYRYIVVTKDNEINLVKDPYSKKQPDINGWSEIYNPDNYEWKSTEWLTGKDPRRITRKPNEPLRGLENLIIEEINIPTLSQEGTFDKAKEHIDNIVEKGIATAIEIMPVENTFSLQWGYDGVDKFAVNEKMGSAVQLKELVDYAHSKGLNVVMDMVPNHIGPDGNFLSQTGPYIGGRGDWGDLYNYEGANNKYVRDYMVNAALWWVNEFKVDGLRLDMTSRCNSDWLLKQIVDEINYHNPDVFLIAEDARERNFTVTAYDSEQIPHADRINKIDKNIENIRNKEKSDPVRAIGFDSEWDFKFMHSLVDSYIDGGSVNIDTIDSKIRNSRHRTKFAMSHDEIGNKDGTRLIAKVMARELNLFDLVNASNDVERGQKAAKLSHELAKLYVTEDIFKLPYNELQRRAREAGMTSGKTINPYNIERAFNIAMARQKLTFATVMTVPGPKMFFQGDDELSLARFKFFREFSDDKDRRRTEPEYIENILKEKGYDYYEPIARPDSLLHSIKYSQNSYADEMLAFSQDLSQIVKSYPALSKGEVVCTHKDNGQLVHTHHLKYDNEEILVIKNYGSNFHSAAYGLANFPEGEWKEIFNSDAKAYGGSNYTNAHRDVINSTNQNLNLAPNSIIILKKI